MDVLEDADQMEGRESTDWNQVGTRILGYFFLLGVEVLRGCKMLRFCFLR